MSQDPSPHSFALREEIDRTLIQRDDFDSWSPRLQAALTEQQTESEFALLRFQMLVWASISGFTLVWDLFAVPEASEVAILWRLLTSLPLAIIGLFVLRKGQSLAMKVVIAATLISLGMLGIYLASLSSPANMARYAMAASFILGLSCLALPFSPTELKRFALTFALATSLTALWPNALPPGELALFVIFTALIGIPAWAMARRHWNLKARAFLLDLRDDLNREELEQSNELLRQLSEQDPLTGMPNRRHFERVCAEGLATSGRTRGGKLALMMIDLDHFKAFNDRHGHQAGDRCLTLAARQLQEVFGNRRGIVARYGGEEFVAALQEREPGEAAALAEEMRAQIAEMLVPVRDDARPLITTSIGLALTPADTMLDLEDVIEMADVALYTAKRAGRDRVEIVEAGVESAQRQDSGEWRRTWPAMRGLR